MDEPKAPFFNQYGRACTVSVEDPRVDFEPHSRESDSPKFWIPGNCVLVGKCPVCGQSFSQRLNDTPLSYPTYNDGYWHYFNCPSGACGHPLQVELQIDVSVRVV